MGNRAVIQFEPHAKAPAIYLHWNGGLCSVQAFLDASVQLLIDNQPTDATETRDRVAQIIANWMGGSVYKNRADKCDRDNGDNGVYVVDWKSMSIVGRLHRPTGYREETNAEKYAAILAETLVKNQNPDAVPVEVEVA